VRVDSVSDEALRTKLTSFAHSRTARHCILPPTSTNVVLSSDLFTEMCSRVYAVDVQPSLLHGEDVEEMERFD